MTEQNLKNNFFVSNLFFMMLAMAFIAGSIIMAILDVPFKLSIVVIQYGIILIPIILMMKFRNYSIKEKFRFNRITVKTGVKSLFITLFSLPTAYTLNYLMNIILIKLDLFQVQSMDLGTGTLNFVVIFFLISITPGICEEVFFRGMMFSGYRDQLDIKKAIIITGFLFGLFHFNLQNLLLPTFLGVIFAWLVYTTDSLYSSMLGHGLFNGVGVFLMYFGPSNDLKGVDIDAGITTLGEEGWSILLGMAAISLVFASFAYLIAKSLKNDFIRIEEGSMLHIGGHNLQVIGHGKNYILVSDHEEEKKITHKKLKVIEYSYTPPVKSEETEKDTISPWNYVFVGVVILMYMLLTIRTYI